MKYAARAWVWVLATALLMAAGCGDQPGGDKMFSLDGDHGDLPETGERWAILLYVSSQPNHYQDARRAKADTADQAGWNDLQVIHESGVSKLLKGSYPSAAAASRDLDDVRKFRFEEGGKPFERAIVVKLPGQDYKPMFPQWDLSKAPGEYTVCVAVFYNYRTATESFSRRRWAADVYCKHLREKENQEAYVHHGQSRSTVTIGAFPEDSVRMVVEGGKKRPEISDPRIEAIMRKYKELIVNGWTQVVTVPDARTMTAEKVVAKTYVVRIPDQKGTDRGEIDRGGNGQPRQTTGDSTGTGRPERIHPWP
ncbi:MAG: hypothetical protein ACLFV7_14645 [Phycisphaerae bacterium]